MEARVVGTATVAFTATGALAEYDVEIRFIVPPTVGQREAFDSAEAKWERILYGDLPDVPTNLAPSWCGGAEPAVNETVDDLIIYVDLQTIDGPGGTLGQAGPCLVRTPETLPDPGTGGPRRSPAGAWLFPGAVGTA